MKASGDSLDIMFWDLTQESQKVLLDFLGVSSPDMCNYDIVPVAVIPKPERGLHRWTKKLDLMHYAEAGFNSETLCGIPMLGNNYERKFPEGTREECPVCLDEIKKRGLKK